MERPYIGIMVNNSSWSLNLHPILIIRHVNKVSHKIIPVPRLCLFQLRPDISWNRRNPLMTSCLKSWSRKPVNTTNCCYTTKFGGNLLGSIIILLSPHMPWKLEHHFLTYVLKKDIDFSLSFQWSLTLSNTEIAWNMNLHEKDIIWSMSQSVPKILDHGNFPPTFDLNTSIKHTLEKSSEDGYIRASFSLPSQRVKTLVKSKMESSGTAKSQSLLREFNRLQIDLDRACLLLTLYFTTVSYLFLSSMFAAHSFMIFVPTRSSQMRAAERRVRRKRLRGNRKRNLHEGHMTLKSDTWSDHLTFVKSKQGISDKDLCRN